MADLKRSQESRVRKMAAQIGYRVTRSRQREHLDNQGQFMLIERERNAVVLGGRYDASLGEIEDYLRAHNGR